MYANHLRYNTTFYVAALGLIGFLACSPLAIAQGAGTCGGTAADWGPLDGSTSYTVVNPNDTYNSTTMVGNGGSASTLLTAEYGTVPATYLFINGSPTITSQGALGNTSSLQLKIKLTNPVCGLGGTQVTAASAATSFIGPGGEIPQATGSATRMTK